MTGQVVDHISDAYSPVFMQWNITRLASNYGRYTVVQIKALFAELIPFNSETNSSLKGKYCNVLSGIMDTSRDCFTPLADVIIRLHWVIVKLLT